MNETHSVLVVEGPPGRARAAALTEMAEPFGGGALWELDGHFDHGGPWAGVKELFSDLIPVIEARRPDLVKRHDYELVHVLPELRARIEVRNPTLTDTAPVEEKTRNYPADRSSRIVHGLIDLLDAWREETGAGRWVLCCDHADRLGGAATELLRELWRRRGRAWGLVYVLGVSPGAAAAVSEALGTAPVRRVDRSDLPADPPETPDPAEAARRLEELTAAVGSDQVAIQIHLPELLRLSREAGADAKNLHWRCCGLEIYNTLGFYEDALVYGAGALDEVERRQPESWEAQWSVFVKMFMSLAGLGRSEDALALATPVFERLGSLKHKGQLCYMISMLHGRYLPRRDYELAEDLLDRGLDMLERAGLPEAELHFQSVFNRNGLAMVRAFQGRLDEALQLCREGLERLEAHLEPGRHRLHRSVLFYNMAQVHARVGAIPEALQDFAAAMAMDPNYSEYYNERGSLLLHAGRYEEALADYRRALELSPPYPEVYINLGHCLRLLGRLEEAIECYGRSLDLMPGQVLAHEGRAQAWEELGRAGEARADYDAAVELDPARWQTRAARAVLLYEAGEHDASLEDLNRAIEHRDDFGDLYQNRAVVLAHFGRADEAVGDLETYLRLSPDAADRADVVARIDSLQRQSAVAP